MNKSTFLSLFQQAKIIQHDADYPLNTPGRPASVLMPLYENDEQLQLLFTVRAKHLKHHGGQISFPGGKQESTDQSLVHTALRESQEEVGISPDEVDIIGQLPVYRTITGYQVTPFIGFVESSKPLVLDKNEVHSTFHVPLSFLLNQSNHFTHWVTRNNKQHPVYFIPWENYTIWGATAAFIRTLSQHVHSYTNPSE